MTHEKTSIVGPKVDASILNRNMPVSARTWFMLSNAKHVARSISEKLVDAWVTDLGNIYVPQGYADSDLPVGRYFASPGHTTQGMLVSVILLGFRDATDRRSLEARRVFRHQTLHPDDLNVDCFI